jgi:tape measure domain-containing protein
MAKSDIRLRILGENKTGAAFNKFKKDINSTQGALNNLRNQIIAAFGVRELVRAGDTFVNLQNRMGALTGTAEGTANAMAHMKRIANESRSDFDSVGDLFAKITFATKEMGLSQQEVADATQTVANTFIISGASAIEASNASRQLAQGLASGTLRGDELNSVMEQNSALAELLAQGLGVSTGKLREMGAAGKITAENILPTLINATADTSKTVADMNMTIGQAINALKTQFTTLVGDFNNSTNAFGAVASGINFVAQNMEILIIPVTVLATTAIPALITSLRALTVTMLANPVGLIAAGFATLVSIIAIVNKQSGDYGGTVEELNTSLDKQNDLLLKQEEAMKTGSQHHEALQAQQVHIDNTKEQIKLIEGLIEAKENEAATVTKVNELLNNSQTTVQKNIKETIQITKDFANTVEGQLTNAFQGFFDIAGKQFLDFKDLATSVARAVINELINVFIVQKLVGMVKGQITDIGAMFEGSTAKAANLSPGYFAAAAQDFGNMGETITIGKKPSGEGGGFTGFGARAGGVDGKGGFDAILHPNETVIDHTKGQSMGATVNFNISTVDAAGFDQLLASRKGLITSIINNAMNNQGKMGIV